MMNDMLILCTSEMKPPVCNVCVCISWWMWKKAKLTGFNRNLMGVAALKVIKRTVRSVSRAKCGRGMSSAVKCRAASRA